MSTDIQVSVQDRGEPDSAVTFGQALDAAINTMRRTGREVRRDGDYIAFSVDHVIYDIPLSACKTHAAILEWTLHLLRKNWVERRHVEAFVYLACEANALTLPN